MTYLTSRRSTPTHRGFTLIELLTVIAIIGILASILIPVVGKVREQARYSTGVSNLRQWALANLLFADENDGFIPHQGRFPARPEDNILQSGIGPWWNELPPYIGERPLVDRLPSGRGSTGNLPRIGDRSIFVCPNANIPSGATIPNDMQWLSYGPSVGLAFSTSNVQAGALTNVGMVRDPSRTVLFAETTNYAEPVPGATANSQFFSTANPRYIPDLPRHNNKSPVSFFDGSVRTFTHAELRAQADDNGSLGQNAPIVWFLRPSS